MGLKIRTVDCRYVEAEFAAAYLIVAPDGSAAFVDNGTSHSLPHLLGALEAEGVSAENVRALIVTHIHLDHAAGTSALLAHCPQAQVMAHPRAAPHLIDPAKLVRSAKLVYGAETFTRLYGEVAPIPAERVRVLADEETWQLGPERLRFLHTRGHANHHFCIWAEGSDALFTGDAFGLSYPQLQRRGGFVFPSTSPTDFDGPEALKTVERILQKVTSKSQVFPTHFGKLRDPVQAGAQLKAWILTSMGWVDEAMASTLSGEELNAWLLGLMLKRFEQEEARLALGWGPPEWELLKLDLKLNAQGLAWTALKSRKVLSGPTVA